MANSTGWIVVISSISMVLCGVILLSISMDQINNKAYSLQLAFNLLLANFGLSMTYFLFYLIHGIGHTPYRTLGCAIGFPFMLYFLIASFGWTVAVALRFKNCLSKDKTMNRVLSRHLNIWVLSFIFTLPIIVLNAFFRPGIELTRVNSYNLCVMHESDLLSGLINIFCMQVPLLLSLLASVIFFVMGLSSLGNSPSSVFYAKARQAGGYLLIIFGVWIMQAIYNVSMTRSLDNDQRGLLTTFFICFAAAQGSCHVLVYTRTSSQFRKWLRRFHFLRSLVRIQRRRRRERGERERMEKEQEKQVSRVQTSLDSESSQQSTSTLSSVSSSPPPVSPSRQISIRPGEAEGDEVGEEEEEDEDLEEGEEEEGEGEKVRQASIAASAEAQRVGTLRSILKVRAPGLSRLMGEGGRSAGASSNGMTSTGTPIRSPLLSLDWGSFRRGGMMEELDNEKFVRFGGVETQIISPRASVASRPSDFSPHDDI